MCGDKYMYKLLLPSLIILAVIVVGWYSYQYKISINHLIYKMIPLFAVDITSKTYNTAKIKLSEIANTLDPKKEMNTLINVQNGYLNKWGYEKIKKFVHYYDKIDNMLKDYNLQDFNLSKLNVATVKLKIFFNHPRPATYKNLITEHGLETLPINIYLKSARSPSYPSGHTTGYYYFYRVASLKDPKNEAKYRKTFENGALSRILAGVHFDIDNKAGIELARILYSDN